MDNIIALGINKNQSWVHSDLDHMSGSVSDGSVSEVDCEIQLSKSFRYITYHMYHRKAKVS